MTNQVRNNLCYTTIDLSTVDENTVIECPSIECSGKTDPHNQEHNNVSSAAIPGHDPVEPTYELAITEVDGKRVEKLRIIWNHNNIAAQQVATQQVAAQQGSCEEELIEAVKQHDLKKLQALLDNIPSNQSHTSLGKTIGHALAIAVKDNQLSIVIKLLQHGSILMDYRSYGVYLACKMGLTQLENLLITGKNNYPEFVHNMAFVYAIWYGDLKTAKELILKGPISELYRSIALQCAIANRHTDCIKPILALGPITIETRDELVKLIYKLFHPESTPESTYHFSLPSLNFVCNWSEKIKSLIDICESNKINNSGDDHFYNWEKPSMTSEPVYLEMLDTILKSGKISEITRTSIVNSLYTESVCTDSQNKMIEVLLEHGPAFEFYVNGYFGLLPQAIRKSHQKAVEALLQNNEIEEPTSLGCICNAIRYQKFSILYILVKDRVFRTFTNTVGNALTPLIDAALQSPDDNL